MKYSIFRNLNFYLHVDFFKIKATVSTFQLSRCFNDNQNIVDLSEIYTIFLTYCKDPFPHLVLGRKMLLFLWVVVLVSGVLHMTWGYLVYVVEVICVLGILKREIILKCYNNCKQNKVILFKCLIINFT